MVLQHNDILVSQYSGTKFTDFSDFTREYYNDVTVQWCSKILLIFLAWHNIIMKVSQYSGTNFIDFNSFTL